MLSIGFVRRFRCSICAGDSAGILQALNPIAISYESVSVKTNGRHKYCGTRTGPSQGLSPGEAEIRAAGEPLLAQAGGAGVPEAVSLEQQPEQQYHVPRHYSECVNLFIAGKLAEAAVVLEEHARTLYGLVAC